VSIALRPQFGTWLGWIVPEGSAIVFVVDDGQDLGDLLRQARNVGYEQLLGVLDGGVAAWQATGRQLDRFPLSPVGVASGTVVDVRQLGEYDTGHLPGARAVELGAIDQTELPAGPLQLMCGHGERAMTAASLLAAHGHTDLTVLTGGPGDWHRAIGEPLETGA
jgi:rhodanese-related sulfurtransferase